MSFVTDIAGSWFGGNESKKAANQAVDTEDPFRAYRGGWASLLNQLITDPNSITSFPGYQFGLSQGSQAIQGSSAAKGMLNSGNTATALNQFGQNYGQQSWLNDVGTLFNIAQGNPAFSSILNQGYQAKAASDQQSIGGLGSIFGLALGGLI